MAEDWQPAAAAEDWQPVANQRVSDAFALDDKPPDAFLDRIARGAVRMGDVFGYTFDLGKAAGHGAVDTTLAQLNSINERLNPFSEAARKGRERAGWTGPGTFIGTGGGLLDLATVPFAPIMGAATELIAKPYSDISGMSIDEARSKVGTALMALGSRSAARFSRPAPGAEIPREIGTLPAEADFKTGAAVLEPDATATVPRPKYVLEKSTHEAEGLPKTSDPNDLVYSITLDGQDRGMLNVRLNGDTAEVRDVYILGERPHQRGVAGTVEVRGLLRQFLSEHPEVTKLSGERVSGARLGGDHVLEGGGIDVEVPVSRREIVEENLRRAWQEDGIHPAEAVHDAQNDAFAKHDITTEPKDFKLDAADAEVLTESGGKPGNLSAAASEPPADIPLAQQPAPRAGSLAASVKNAADTLLDIGRDAQMLVAPMARGTTDSMAIAKDFANTMRRNRWEWSRIDADIEKRFTPEQRTRMWNAADEESVARQLGESTEHQGLTTLTAEERAAVEDLQTRAQTAWLRAVDLGMVEGEGLPAYTPRMVMNATLANAGDSTVPLNGIGLNLRTKTAGMRQRQHMTVEETEAAAKAKYGNDAYVARDIRALPLATGQLEDAIAGRTLINNVKDYGKRTGAETVSEGAIPKDAEGKWFTLDHPAFRTWRPKFKEKEGGGVEVVKDAEGNTVFEQVPIYVHGDFEGPLRAVLTQRSGPLYGAMMSLKGKTMSLIMNSPMIHNAVEWGRALPAMPGKVATFKVYFEGNRVKNDPVQMREAIDAGLVPIGKRFFNQDITGIMESPDLAPGRSLTAKVLAAVPGLFDEGAGTAVKRSIDKAGDFWHNTLLWDRIADLQAGLYSNFRDDMLAKGMDRQTASRVAAHWANRYAGALPQEAMSDGARKVANLLLFSRSFTLGNLGAMKDMLTGLPKDVIAQIERDAGFRAGAINEAGELAGPEVEAVKYAKTLARRKAMSIVALDIGLMYVGNSMLQSVINVVRTDRTADQEMKGYADRFAALMEKVKEHPLTLLQPFHLLESLSSTSENEPGKGDRIRVGTSKDGTAIYMRNPAGKIGEEFVGYMNGPLDMMRRKLGTIARPGWQILANDKGFGRKVYDPNADTPAKYVANLGRIAGHIAASQVPEGQMNAAMDLVKGEGDKNVNAAQALGPIAGVTFSKGAPGGPAVGEMYKAREMHDFQVQQALPDIRKQIQRGDFAGAQARMDQLKIPRGLQNFYMRTSQFPETRLGGRTLKDFYQYATPEQIQRLERAKGARP